MRNAMSFALVCPLMMLVTGVSDAQAPVEGRHWNAPDRADRVMGLIPGQRLPNLTPETLFADWTAQQVERWQRENPGETIDEVCERAVDPAAVVLPLSTSFEAEDDPRWQLSATGAGRIQRAREHATEGEWALRLEAPRGEHSGVSMAPREETDWTGRYALVLDAYWDGPEHRLGVRLDADGLHYWSLRLQSGLNRDLAIAVAGARDRVDLTNTRRLLVYITDPAADGALYLDNVRWQARPMAPLLSDREITEDFPMVISPYGRVRSGNPDPWAVERVMTGYCPFCGSRALSFSFSPDNRYHATTTCCRKDLYGATYPENYDLIPNATTSFSDLDGNIHEVPTVIYTDGDGVQWELFIPTIFANKRWADMARLCTTYMQQFQETADPAYAYKLALLLDKTADTYYGLPPSWFNELCEGRDGEPLTRAEWEAVTRPSVTSPPSLGYWNRRVPIFNRGWLRQANEAIWAEPFARVRHHPAFRHYSEQVYGDPEELDRRVRHRLMRQIALSWENIGHGLYSNYQDAIYTNELLVAVLADRTAMLDFAAPNNELTLYNHYYHDGLCGEGAPNYMAMPGGYYFRPLRDPEGAWRAIYPEFLQEHPFFEVAADEWRKLRTARGLSLEFGDQHLYAYAPPLTNPDAVAEREALGSENWPAWGMGLLRVGGPGKRMELTLSYPRPAQHTASDQLGMACWVDGIPVMRPGGYAHHPVLTLQWERPEIQGLHTMGYPKEIVQVTRGDLGFSGWPQSPMAQNAVTVNETFPSMGWSNNRGYGELITFKGGEAPGEAGARFQVIEARDRYSFERVGQPVQEYRRALLGVERADGRPYVVDIVTLRGGQRHALYNSAWAERGEANLPPVKDRADNLLHLLEPPVEREVLGDVAFPAEWALFGPVDRDAPEPDMASLEAVPEVLEIGDERLQAQRATFTDKRLDLGALLDGKEVGKTAYLLASIRAEKDMEVTLGAGADWWMKWWVNGKVVCDTLAVGNDAHPPSFRDQVFVARLQAGENLIAAKVISGSGSFVVAAGGPRELRAVGPAVARTPTRRERVLSHVRDLEVLERPQSPWSVTWHTDYAAYAPRDPHGAPFQRPLPDDIGRVRLRFLGLPVPGQETGLIRARGPWVSIVNQPLSDGNHLRSNVGFLDATDLLIETHHGGGAEEETASRFVHVLEGIPEGQNPVIRTARVLPVASADDAEALAVEVTHADGLVDLVVYQEEPGLMEFGEGFTTDARYALVRLNAEGRPVEAHMVEGTVLSGNGLDLAGPAVFAGTIVDLIGDLTGTRTESAVVIQPDEPWPAEPPSGARQLVIEGPNALRSPIREAYALGGITPQEDGTVRLDLANSAPLAVSWHQVTEMDPERRGFFRTNRPMLAGSQTPWLRGMKAWFPRLDKTLTFERLTGGFHGSTEGLMHDVDFAAEGVEPGDWFVLHSLEPGMRVSLPATAIWGAQ